MMDTAKTTGGVVGTPVPHESAVGHVTGTADYVADIPASVDELVVGFVGSPVASGRLVGVDIEGARAVPGVVAILTAADVPGALYFGPIVADEPILAQDEVLYVGQPVVVLAAETAEALARARDLVRIQVEPSKPILTIDHALTQQRFLGAPRRIVRGDPVAAMAAAPHRLTGVFHSLGQEHFYFESQAVLACPGEDGLLVVHASTQGPTELQHVVARTLGLGMHQVVVSCRRMGGGFGGKETQGCLPAAMAALVAHRTGRPARLVYGRAEDMRSTGKRHAYRTEWEVGFDGDGTILSYRVAFQSDGGASTDLSPSVLERSLLHADNAYHLPDVEIRGQVCFTNHASSTAFRGFGGPQALAVMEHVLREITAHLQGLPRPHGTAAPEVLDVQRRNLYRRGAGQTTPYGQSVEATRLPEIVELLAERSDYQARLVRITAQNPEDPRWLRGLALVPVKFGISFVSGFMNQANAMVHLFTDGTIQVSCGGTEMGQGLYTKVRQLVADAFGLPLTQVRVMPTSTEKSHNTTPTAASAGTDLNGAAALQASHLIRERLAALAATTFAVADPALSPDLAAIVFADGQVMDSRRPGKAIPLSDLATKAWLARIDLGARGFYTTPGISYDYATGRGSPFYYYAQGATVAEVRVDRFTGEVTVPRADILIDVGRSINPGVDRGQVIGGFVQGMGWVTGECLVYDDAGVLLTDAPATYKIPAVSDLPEDLRLDFYQSPDAVGTVVGSKAVGEPPLMHAIAVWAAIKHALSAVSPQAASRLRLPATGEEILRALAHGEQPRALDEDWPHSATMARWPRASV